MRQRLTRCRDAIVATEAAGGDASMVKATHWRPGDGRVATIASGVSLNMSRRHAHALHIVVAGSAAAAHFAVFKTYHRSKGNGGVAGLAAFGAQNMRGALASGPDSRADGVTAHAHLRRGFEYGAHMATLTVDITVGTRELKASGKVIEIALRRRCGTDLHAGGKATNYNE
jgi:hypothetical protein